MNWTFCIDCFPESAARYRQDYAIIVVDVIRATTTAVTAVNAGLRVIPAGSLDEVFSLARSIHDPLLVGEINGVKPPRFDLTNSPVQVDRLAYTVRPIILLSSSGTRLMVNAAGAQAVFVACLRNYTAIINYVAKRFAKIAIIGAGSRLQFRNEDKLGCAYLGKLLLERGYTPENGLTHDLVNYWGAQPTPSVANGRSAEYLKTSNQLQDLDFIMSHIDDLCSITALVDGEIRDLGRKGLSELTAPGLDRFAWSEKR